MNVKTIEFEARTREEALEEATKEFRVNPEYITLEMTEKKGLLGIKKHYHVKATLDVDIIELGMEILETLFKNMGVKATIEMRHGEEGEIGYHIETDENPVLIGRNGKTLDGIQSYLRNLLNMFTEEYAMILVDIGGYRENRRRQLEILATKTAKDVARTKIAVKLTPMNAYERRIVHTKLAEWRDVETVSEGEHPDRYIIIRPKQ